MEATIRSGEEIVTLVNVMTVEPANQQRLVQALREGTDAFFSRQPGFVTSSVMASKDGRRVVNLSQWASLRDVEAFRQDPTFGPYVQRIAELATVDTFAADLAYVNRA